MIIIIIIIKGEKADAIIIQLRLNFSGQTTK